jgi:hypothetical protein
LPVTKRKKSRIIGSGKEQRFLSRVNEKI